MSRRFSGIVVFLTVGSGAQASLGTISAGTIPAGTVQTNSSSSWTSQWDSIRQEITRLEESLVDEASQRNPKLQLRKIQKLLKLHEAERQLGEKRLGELESTVTDLESRRAVLNEKMTIQRKSIQHFLVAIEASMREGFSEGSQSFRLPEKWAEQEKLEAPRRKVLANLVDRGVKEVEALRVDLSDANQLEVQIQDEKQQLAYLFQDLKEQEGVLELNRQLQVDILKRNRVARLSQLENYRKLKNAEAQVEHLIGNFNARMELKSIEEAERAGGFLALKGKLPSPVANGRVVSSFGRVFDARSGLFVFKKGIDIDAGKHETVHAVSSGKVAYAGELPHYGQVVIIDHGDHFYSISAHLGSISKKTNDLVGAQDTIGVTDDLSTPVYFEIRSRNVAVNPLQWMFN